jgi:serine protease AprX
MNTMGTPSRFDDKVTSYSSKGPTAIDHYAKPDLVAPGNRILSLDASGSTLNRTYPENRVPRYVYTSKSSDGVPDYYQLSGTSMAAPMVGGAAALLLQKNPAMTPDQVKARLMRTASKFAQTTWTSADPDTGVAYTSYSDVFTIGAGYLDVQAALANQDLADLPATSPTALYDPNTGMVYLADNLNVVWDNRSRWGLSDVWGAGAVSAFRSCWKLTSGSGDATAPGAYMSGAALLGAASVWEIPTASGFGNIWSTSARPAAAGAGVEDLSIALDGEN